RSQDARLESCAIDHRSPCEARCRRSDPLRLCHLPACNTGPLQPQAPQGKLRCLPAPRRLPLSSSLKSQSNPLKSNRWACILRKTTIVQNHEVNPNLPAALALNAVRPPDNAEIRTYESRDHGADGSAGGRSIRIVPAQAL